MLAVHNWIHPLLFFLQDKMILSVLLPAMVTQIINDLLNYKKKMLPDF